MTLQDPTMIGIKNTNARCKKMEDRIVIIKQQIKEMEDRVYMLECEIKSSLNLRSNV